MVLKKWPWWEQSSHSYWLLNITSIFNPCTYDGIMETPAYINVFLLLENKSHIPVYEDW